jgi:hypothetical protein
MRYVRDNHLEVVVLQRSSSRFEWRLHQQDGTIVAKGRASDVLQARSEAIRAQFEYGMAREGEV